MTGIASAAITELAELHPRLVFRTELGNRHMQPQFLRGRQCEVSLTRRVSDLCEPDMEEQPLFHERLLVVAGADNPLARRRKSVLRDLADASWVLAPHEAEAGGPVFEGFRDAGFAMPQVSILSYSLSLRYSLLLKGPYVTCIPASVMRFGPKLGFIKVLPIELPPWQQPTVMMTLKDRSRSPAAEAFMDRIRSLSVQMNSG
ncbi:substrate-binding domain-containing protein [Bosea eneae]|uniref:Substrate-binding domain-containing protein n=1 Tax=Bosea eneae TaxID=151454 RepID=A0ABW0ILL2_9HYPH